MRIKYTLIIIMLLLCSGCLEDKVKTEAEINKGKLRHELFVECMQLAAKMPRQADDDVADIVKACGTQSYYMANQMSE